MGLNTITACMSQIMKKAGTSYRHKPLILITALFVSIATAAACETEVHTDKTVYSVGDVAELTLQVKQDHGRCHESGVLPEVAVRGGEIESRSSFEEISPGVWQISYKVVIVGNDAALRLVRNCHKGGFEIVHEFDIR